MTDTRDKWAWRKQEYRCRMTQAERDAANDRVKAHQKTFRGRFSVFAGRSNTGAKQRGYRGKVTGSEMIRLFYAQNGSKTEGKCDCAQCKEPVCIYGTVIIDHVTPLKAGGRHEIQNIQILCVKCDKIKTGRDRRAMGMFGSGQFGQREVKPMMVQETLF